MPRFNSCNLLQAGVDTRRVWQFDARSAGFKLNREHAAHGENALPSGVVEKSWSSLWQPKLNVAWLPSDCVFLRVVHLPAGSPAEVHSMIELQLERLSPIPITQMVWSVQVLGTTPAGLQTAIITFAERKAVEDFLGKLESQGFLADKLELPALDLISAVPVTDDGAWIFPGAWGGPGNALVAWWQGGVLQSLNFVSLTASADRVAGLKEQFSQMVWAGELEGWLTSAPQWHLVADESAAAEWEPSLRASVDAPIRIVAPPALVELAGLTAKRAASADGTAGLLPGEFSKRYQQQFVDRLWFHGLGTALAVYVLYCLVYFAALGVLSFQTGRVEKQVSGLGPDYTNTMSLRARYDVLKERQELKFAALDSWKAVAELLPELVTIEGFNFQEGRKITLNGTAPKAEVTQVIDFSSAIRKAKKEEQALFDSTKGENLTYRQNPDGSVGWNFGLELKRVEAP